MQTVYRKHGGCALCPKDLRASFITWLRSGDHGDDVLTAAAVAMRHDSSTQRSAAYDKDGTQRQVDAAFRATAAMSATFMAT